MGDGEASKMAAKIHNNLDLTISMNQLRQISTLMLSRKGLSKSEKPGKLLAAVPLNVTDNPKDNSSGSTTSALTDASHLGRKKQL